VDEIRLNRDEFLESMEEFASVLAFLLETMSAAQDLTLPYAYQDAFEYGGGHYSLLPQDGYRVLQRVG
jgi:hypothetical protein